jgi:hypothetical protein
MRYIKMALAVLLFLTLVGCGGGGGGSTPAPVSDTTAPTVSITAPANNASVKGVTTVSANANDNVSVTKVEFYQNGVLQATATSAPYNFSWDTSPLAKGSYTLASKAYDAAGNVGSSASVVVTVPLSVSMDTVITGSTAVGTISLHGLAAPDAFGLDLQAASLPAGADIASVTATGGAAAAFAFKHTDNVTVSLAGSSAFGSGEVMLINFVNVPAGAVPADFTVSLLASSV